MTGSSGGQNTVTQTTAIPQYEQDFSQNNQNLAASLQAQPYPNYSGQLIAPLNSYQNQGLSAAVGNAYDYGNEFYNGQATTNANAQGVYNPTQVMQNAPSVYNADSTVANQLGQLNPNQAMSIPGQVTAPSVTSAASAVQPTMNAA